MYKNRKFLLTGALMLNLLRDENSATADYRSDYLIQPQSTYSIIFCLKLRNAH